MPLSYSVQTITVLMNKNATSLAKISTCSTINLIVNNVVISSMNTLSKTNKRLNRLRQEKIEKKEDERVWMSQTFKFKPTSLGLGYLQNVVVGVQPGGQADKFGVLVGWQIVKINNEEIGLKNCGLIQISINECIDNEKAITMEFRMEGKPQQQEEQA